MAAVVRFAVGVGASAVAYSVLRDAVWRRAESTSAGLGGLSTDIPGLPATSPVVRTESPVPSWEAVVEGTKAVAIETWNVAVVGGRSLAMHALTREAPAAGATGGAAPEGPLTGLIKRLQ